jgi:iron complex transport system permease protein
MTTPEPAHTHRPLFERRDLALMVVLSVLLGVGAMARLWLGPVGVSLDLQVLGLRAHRLAISLIAGGGLAVAGVLLQALLRNPLASPYIIGVSSGAALGVVMGLAGWLTFLGAAGEPLAALVAALVTLIIIYGLSQKRGWIDPLGLLLVGVIVNAINGAIIMFIHYLDPLGMGVDLNRWMLGYIDEGLSRWVVIGVGATTLGGIGLATWLGRSIDVATFSDAEAHSLGLHLPRLRLGLFGVAGLLTAGAVLLVGPIGFVGLICPHLVRLIIGPRHTPLILGSALCGAALLVWADVIIDLADVGQGQMPVGIVMALVGGPVFLWMLRSQLGRGGAP